MLRKHKIDISIACANPLQTSWPWLPHKDMKTCGTSDDHSSKLSSTTVLGVYIWVKIIKICRAAEECLKNICTTNDIVGTLSSGSRKIATEHNESIIPIILDALGLSYGKRLISYSLFVFSPNTGTSPLFGLWTIGKRCLSHRRQRVYGLKPWEEVLRRGATCIQSSNGARPSTMAPTLIFMFSRTSRYWTTYRLCRIRYTTRTRTRKQSQEVNQMESNLFRRWITWSSRSCRILHTKYSRVSDWKKNCSKYKATFHGRTFSLGKSHFDYLEMPHVALSLQRRHHLYAECSIHAGDIVSFYVLSRCSKSSLWNRAACFILRST